MTGRRPDPFVAAGTAGGTSVPNDLHALKGQTRIGTCPPPMGMGVDGTNQGSAAASPHRPALAARIYDPAVPA
jgi:hypothetical protein